MSVWSMSSGGPKIPSRFLGAFRCGHRQTSRPFIDEELSWELLRKIIASNYTDEESIQALDFITKFNNEFHKAFFDKEQAPLHNTDTLRKSCSDRNNARNRDILSREYRFLKSLNREEDEH